jgi:hypothetical protein
MRLQLLNALYMAGSGYVGVKQENIPLKRRGDRQSPAFAVEQAG